MSNILYGWLRFFTERKWHVQPLQGGAGSCTSILRALLRTGWRAGLFLPAGRGVGTLAWN